MIEAETRVAPPFDDGRSALLVFPCNGNALEAMLSLPPRYHFIGYVDDAPDRLRHSRDDQPVFGREAFELWPEAQVLAVPGSALSFRKRAALIDGLGLPRHRFATLIDASARVSPMAQIGQNVLIMAGVVITSNAVLEDDVCVLPNSVIHHDVIIGRFTLIGANVTIAGSTIIGRGCYIGSGSSVTNGIGIGDGALIGLGSVVIRHVAPGATIAGNPARRLR